MSQTLTFKPGSIARFGEQSQDVQAMLTHFKVPGKGDPIIDCAGLRPSEVETVKQLAQKWAADFNRTYDLLEDL